MVEHSCLSCVSHVCLLQAQGNCSKSWTLPPLGKRGKFHMKACCLVLIKCKYVCVCIFICFSLHGYLQYKAPEQFACYQHVASFLPVSGPVMATSPLNCGKGNFIMLSLVSTQKGQGEEKTLLPAVGFPGDPWMNVPFVFSSSIYSPVQQLPADSGNQENRRRDVPLWGPDIGSWGDQLQRYSGHRERWAA